MQWSVEVWLGSTDRSEVGRIVDIVARLAKDRMVQEVERFSTELELLFSPDGERTNDGRIEIDPPLILLRVCAPISIRIFGGNLVGRCVEPCRSCLRPM